MYFENQIFEFDLVKLTDGREVLIIGVLDDPEPAYLCEDVWALRSDNDLADGLVFTVKPEEIREVTHWGIRHEYGHEPTRYGPEDAGELKQFSCVELVNGRHVVILDIYENSPGYEVEDVYAQLTPGYDGSLSFGVDPSHIKRVVWSPKD